MDSPNQANEEDEKMKRVAILCFTSILLISLSGCRYISMVLEKDKTAFNDTITALFLALDEGDSEAIYNLFSPSVRKQDQDLKEQIEQLLSIYEGPVEKIAWDGLGGRSNSYNHGTHHNTIFATFPVRTGNTYYWCYMDLMYENTYDSQQIGITQLDFYTADEFCIKSYDPDWKMVESVGLTVHADATIDCEIRCIDGYPYMYSTSTKPLNLRDVKKFLRTSDSYSEFTELFGEPNAEQIFCYYELATESGEARYLQISEYENTIVYACVVNEFEYIETVYDE
jgi:hypothetical protein